MSAPDFYFALNAIFRHLHDRYGKAALVEYWRELGRDYYHRRWQTWAEGGAAAVADDWRAYFAREPGADVATAAIAGGVELQVRVCPVIAHLRQNGRDVVPYFCEHCDHVGGAMAEAAGLRFVREGGGGSCRQQFLTEEAP